MAKDETLVSFYCWNANLAAKNITENYIILKLEDETAPVSQPPSTHVMQMCSRRSLDELQQTKLWKDKIQIKKVIMGAVMFGNLLKIGSVKPHGNVGPEGWNVYFKRIL